MYYEYKEDIEDYEYITSDQKEDIWYQDDFEKYNLDKQYYAINEQFCYDIEKSIRLGLI